MTSFFKEVMQTSIKSVIPVSGGDINDAYKIETATDIFFAKVNSSANAFDILNSEAKSLQFLRSLNAIRVPEVIKTGKISDRSALVLEWIESGYSDRNSKELLGIMIANLHLNTAQTFGLEFDNFIGTLTQVNFWTDNWLDFYYNHRIQAQLQPAVEAGLIPPGYIRKADKVFYNIQKEMPTIGPSLLHGDLWAGNYMTDISGAPVLIDPAISYGHREMDIAMMHLFGGFDSNVISAYESISPLEDDWRIRMKFYQLYYILVHVNLFGGYYAQSAMNIIDHYA
jgi:fructosamine-3-kinase